MATESTGNAPWRLGTKDAEWIARKIADREKIVWIPAPYYADEDQYHESIRIIETTEAGEFAKPWEWD